MTAWVKGYRSSLAIEHNLIYDVKCWWRLKCIKTIYVVHNPTDILSRSLSLYLIQLIVSFSISFCNSAIIFGYIFCPLLSVCLVVATSYGKNIQDYFCAPNPYSLLFFLKPLCSVLLLNWANYFSWMIQSKREVIYGHYIALIISGNIIISIIYAAYISIVHFEMKEVYAYVPWREPGKRKKVYCL